MKSGGGSPAFFHSQRRTKRLAGEVEAAAFIAEDVTPTSRARSAAGEVPAEAEGTGAGDGDDAWRARGGAHKRDEPVVRDGHLFHAKDLLKQRLFVRRAAAEAAAGRAKADMSRIDC